ncbi:MAG: hypothetical protein QF619_14095, partial [Candidatus Binatia bacterium]|nr:hypothetical protein [Candidatus Binatia bacterium]
MDWDLTPYFPQFNGIEMKEFKEKLRGDISDLIKTASMLTPLTGGNEDRWEGIFEKYEDLLKRLSHLGSYIGCHAAADSRNEEYLQEESEMALIRADISKLKIEILRALKESGDETFISFINREALKGASHYLRRLREESQRTMNPDQEKLAADLGVDG